MTAAEILKCKCCGIEKPSTEFSRNPKGKDGYRSLCKKCRSLESRKRYRANPKKYNDDCTAWRHRTGRCKPAMEAKGTGVYIGYLAEKLLSNFFDDITVMPNCNPGYDFVCRKGYKIDVKSARPRHVPEMRIPRWEFYIKKNKCADYFLCLAFGECNLEPVHVWLIPGEDINDKALIRVSDNRISLDRWSKYEHELDRVLACRNGMLSAGVL